MAAPDRIEARYVSFQPQTHEILAAFGLYSTKFPQDEQELARGLLAAVEKAPFLRRFVDGGTGQLTDETRISLQKLQENQLLITENGSFVIPTDTTKRDKLSSLTRMYFKNDGIEALKEAAIAAGRVWFPQ